MVTKRTTNRKAFLAPWHPEVQQAYAYTLAHAQQEYEVAVHTVALPINHDHLDVTPKHKNLPRFVGYLHSESSKAIQTVMRHDRYDVPGEVWDKRQPHYLRQMDAAAQIIICLYIRLNCVAAGLVARPDDMPGFHFGFDMWKQRYIEIKKPSVFYGDGRPDTIILEVTPPPLLYEAFDGDDDALVAHMQRLEREQIHRLAANRKRAPLGAQRVQRIHPWDEPKTMRERGGRPLPTFFYGARDANRVQLDIAGAREVGHFQRDHTQVRIARRDGDLTQVFPYGTYKERVVHGAPVLPVPEEGTAAIAMPGPTLEDIEVKLAARGQADPEVTAAQVEALVTETRAVIEAEAQEVVADATDDVGDFREKAKDRADARTVVVRHRLDRHPPQAGSGVKRIITKRDRKRGRPRQKQAAHNKHGADPPA